MKKINQWEKAHATLKTSLNEIDGELSMSKGKAIRELEKTKNLIIAEIPKYEEMLKDMKKVLSIYVIEMTRELHPTSKGNFLSVDTTITARGLIKICDTVTQFKPKNASNMGIYL